MPRVINPSRDAELWYHDTIIRSERPYHYIYVSSVAATENNERYRFRGVSLPVFDEQGGFNPRPASFSEDVYQTAAFVAEERRVVIPARLYFLEDVDLFVKVCTTTRHSYRRSINPRSVSVQVCTPTQLANNLWNCLHQQRNTIFLNTHTGMFNLSLPPNWFITSRDAGILPPLGLIEADTPSLEDADVLVRNLNLSEPMVETLGNYLLQRASSNRRGIGAYINWPAYQALLLESLRLPTHTVSAQDFYITHDITRPALLEGNLMYLPLHPNLSQEKLDRYTVPFAVILDSIGTGFGYINTPQTAPNCSYLEMLRDFNMREAS